MAPGASLTPSNGSDALESMSKYKYGVCFCVNKKSGKLLGILTDGDVRRKILNVQKPFSALLNDDLILHINKKPSKVLMNSSLSTAVRLMKKKKNLGFTSCK